MVAVWTQTLMSAAEISNFFSALGVILCFICMVVFILRVQGIQLASPSVVHVGQPSPVQINFKKIGIPFMCFLNTPANGPSKELEFKLTIDVACYLQVFWSVPASMLKNLLYMPWENFVEKLEDCNKLEAKVSEDTRFLEPEEPNETRIIRLNAEQNHAPLGKAPRSHFPLVLVVTRKEEPGDADSNVAALISIIHISDDDCPMPSTILYQYLKQYSGQLTQLQTLYTQRTEQNLNAAKRMEDESLSSNFDNPFENEVNENGACVICRVMQPTRALLPCRHVCVCSFCFSRLDVCPLCRARISAFFLTDPKEEQRQAEMSEEEKRSGESSSLNRHRSFINNMNSVLNSFLGLRED